MKQIFKEKTLYVVNHNFVRWRGFVVDKNLNRHIMTTDLNLENDNWFYIIPNNDLLISLRVVDLHIIFLSLKNGIKFGVQIDNGEPTFQRGQFFYKFHEILEEI